MRADKAVNPTLKNPCDIICYAGTSFIIFEFFLLTLLSFSFFLFPVASFLQSTTIGRTGWNVTDAGGTTYRSRPPRAGGRGGGVCVPLFFVLYSHLLFFSLFFFRLFLFFVMINKRRLGVGPDRTDEVGDRNTRGTRLWGEATGTCHIIFLFSRR